MKKITALLLCFVLILSVSGCGEDKGPKEITLLTLSNYMPKDTLNEFTEKTGISISHVTAASYDEIEAMVKKDPSAYDLVITNDSTLNSLTEQNLLQEIDYKKFDNSKYVVEGYKGKYYDPENKYTVPYAAVGVLIGYDPELTGIIIDSYADLLAPELKDSIVFADDHTAMVGIANMALGRNPDFYTPNMFDAANILASLSKNFCSSSKDTAYVEDALVSGDASVGVLYTIQLGYAVAANPKIEIVYPKEGFICSIDCMAIPNGADGKDYAMQFINYAHDPVVNGKLCQEIGYSSTNTSGKQFMDEEYRNDGYNIKNDKAGEGLLFPKQENAAKQKFEGLYNQYFLAKINPASSTPPADTSVPTEVPVAQ